MVVLKKILHLCTCTMSFRLLQVKLYTLIVTRLVQMYKIHLRSCTLYIADMYCSVRTFVHLSSARVCTGSLLFISSYLYNHFLLRLVTYFIRLKLGWNDTSCSDPVSSDVELRRYLYRVNSVSVTQIWRTFSTYSDGAGPYEEHIALLAMLRLYRGVWGVFTPRIKGGGGEG